MKNIVSESENIRIDKYLSKELENISRSRIQKLIDKGDILVNGKRIKSNYKLDKDDLINIRTVDEEKISIKAEEGDLDIIYEDDDIVIVNKDIDLIVHPSSQNTSNTLVNKLLYHIDSLSDAGEYYRPGIVHRLDKDTSGIMVIAKNNKAYVSLVDQFKYGKVKRYYIAIVDGHLAKESFTIDMPIGRDVNNRTRMAVNQINSKKAITKYRLMENYEKCSLVELELLTGRMHQIRVHMSYLGNPVIGDEKYGKKDKRAKGQLLHARKLEFLHPRSGEPVSFKTNFPERFKEYLD